MTNRVRAAGLVLTVLACADEPTLRPVTDPNVIIFLADDQGWTGTSVRMDPAEPSSRSDYYLTPSLEAFAEQGLRFSNAYAAAPICSPNRASLQTGRSPAALHMTGVLAGPVHPREQPRRLLEPPLSDGLPLTETTLAEAIREGRPDYVTGHFGKWHLGSKGPGEHGYAFHHPGNAHPQEATDLALAFIRAQVESQASFVLQISHYAVHKGFVASENARRAVRYLKRGERHRNADVAAMTLDLDADFGRVLRCLEELGVEDRTYVFYLSDNGGYTDTSNNRPLSGGKFSTLEGGIRIPFLVRGPGVPKGAASPTPIITWDLFPTVLDLIGVRDPPSSEGGSLAPLLIETLRESVERPREELVWHYPHYYHLLGGSAPQSAIRWGRYKLLVDYEADSAQLFDLEQDLGESHDLSDREPDIARRLREQLEQYLRAVGAQMARPRQPGSGANRGARPQ